MSSHFFFYIYKIYLISTEGYKKANIDHLIVQKTGEIWASMKNAGSGIGVKNISDLVLKEMHGMLKIKIPTKKQKDKDKRHQKKNWLQLYQN